MEYNQKGAKFIDFYRTSMSEDKKDRNDDTQIIDERFDLQEKLGTGAGALSGQ